MKKKKNLSTDGKPFSESNPLPEVVNFIPWEYRILDLEFVDELKDIVRKYYPKLYLTNKYVLLMIAALHDAGYISRLEVPTEQPGRVILIKRI